MKKISLLTLSTLCAGMTYAGSFQLNLQGMQQTAMGGSGVAWPWDVSTIFFNPGGLSRLKGVEAYASGYFVSPHIRYVSSPEGSLSSDTKMHTSTPFAVYVGGPLKKDSRWGLGIGMYTPFGNSANWDYNWPGRYVIRSISLESFFVQPTLSYRINDYVSVGAGFVYGFGTVDIKKAIPVQYANGADGTAMLKGNANGIGFNAGVQIKATDYLQFGVSYRSAVDMKVNNGNANFDVPAAAAASFPATGFSSKLPLPSILTVGFGVRPWKKLVLQGDVVFAGWNSYDSLKFDFKQHTSSLQDMHDPRNYKNTVAVRFGARYQLCDELALMAGAAYDPTPTQSDLVSPDAVDADRTCLSGGLTYKPVPRLSLMAAVYYTTTSRREVTYTPDNFQGAYQIKSVIPAVGISYAF